MENDKYKTTDPVYPIFIKGGEDILDAVKSVLTQLKEIEQPPSQGVEFLANIIEILMVNMMSFIDEDKQENFLMRMQVTFFRNVLEQIKEQNPEKPESKIILQ